MKTLALAATLLLAAGVVHAAPYAGADIQAGKKTAEQKCNACHAKTAGGDGSSIYTRKTSQIKTSDLLTQQMEMCDSMGHGKLSDTERKNVLGWLNSQYYHFK
ncbi:MAG: cytochrome c [Rhodocyclaceae bacterium]|nr:cytochrome c [Rhodocyclaceae bacterium]